MKTYLFEQNGFPKSLGFLLIVLILSVTCCSQYLVAQSSDEVKTSVRFMISIPEVIIVHEGFEFPPRVVVNPVPSPTKWIDFVADYSYWNRPRYDNLEILAGKVRDRKKTSEMEKIRKIVDSVGLSEEETGDPKPMEENSTILGWLKRSDNS